MHETNPQGWRTRRTSRYLSGTPTNQASAGGRRSLRLFRLRVFRIQVTGSVSPARGCRPSAPLITSRTDQLPVAGQFPTIRHCRSNRFTFLSLESRTSFLTGGERGVTSSGRRGSGPCRPQRADTPWELRPADRFRQWFSLFPGPRSRGLRKDIRGRSAGCQ